MHVLLSIKPPSTKPNQCSGATYGYVNKTFKTVKILARETRGLDINFVFTEVSWVTRLDGLNVRDLRGSKTLIRQALMSVTLLALSQQFGSLYDHGLVVVIFSGLHTVPHG